MYVCVGVGEQLFPETCCSALRLTPIVLYPLALLFPNFCCAVVYCPSAL